MHGAVLVEIAGRKYVLRRMEVFQGQDFYEQTGSNLDRGQAEVQAADFVSRNFGNLKTPEVILVVKDGRTYVLEEFIPGARSGMKEFRTWRNLRPEERAEFVVARIVIGDRDYASNPGKLDHFLIADGEKGERLYVRDNELAFQKLEEENIARIVSEEDAPMEDLASRLPWLRQVTSDPGFVERETQRFMELGIPQGKARADAEILRENAALLQNFLEKRLQRPKLDPVLELVGGTRRSPTPEEMVGGSRFLSENQRRLAPWVIANHFGLPRLEVRDSVLGFPLNGSLPARRVHPLVELNRTKLDGKDVIVELYSFFPDYSPEGIPAALPYRSSYYLKNIRQNGLALGYEQGRYWEFANEADSYKILQRLSIRTPGMVGILDFRDGRLALATQEIPKADYPERMRAYITEETVQELGRIVERLTEAGYTAMDFQYLVEMDGYVTVVYPHLVSIGPGNPPLDFKMQMQVLREIRDGVRPWLP